MVMGTSTLREAPLVSFSYRPKMSVHILSVVFRSIHTQGPKKRRPTTLSKQMKFVIGLDKRNEPNVLGIDNPLWSKLCLSCTHNLLRCKPKLLLQILERRRRPEGVHPNDGSPRADILGPA